MAPRHAYRRGLWDGTGGPGLEEWGYGSDWNQGGQNLLVLTPPPRNAGAQQSVSYAPEPVLLTLSITALTSSCGTESGISLSGSSKTDWPNSIVRR